MVQTTCCGEGQECIVTDVSGLADPCMASCNVFYRLPDGSIWLLNKTGDGYLPVFVANDVTKIDWNADPNSLKGISNRPFKAIGEHLSIDSNGNLNAEMPEQIQVDWEQLTETAKDHIKNKPFQTLNPDDFEVDENGVLNYIGEIALHTVVDETEDEAVTPKAVREALYADAGKDRVQIGLNASSVGSHSTAVGYEAKTGKDFSVAIGDYSRATETLTVAIGNGANASFPRSVALGANSTTTREYAVAVNYGAYNRTIEGVKDPTQPQDAMTKMYADQHYVNLTQPQTVTGLKEFNDIKQTGDTSGWVTITERLNGFTGGSIKYKKRLGVVTLVGDDITPPAIAVNTYIQLFTVPAIILNEENMRAETEVSGRAITSHIDSTGKFFVQAGPTAITTSQKIHFTITYLM